MILASAWTNSVWSATGLLPPPPIQNRACAFQRTRLLSAWSFVIDTSRFVCSNHRYILSSFLIVAMSVVHPLVADVVPPTQSRWYGVIDFQGVSVLKVEATSWTLPFLESQKFCSLASHQGVLLESFRPVDQVSIIGTCLPSDFGMVLAVRIRMVPHIQRFRGSFVVFDVGAKPASPIHFDGVLFPGPSFALSLKMSRLSPSCELLIRRAVADAERLRTDHPFVIVRPPSNDGRESTDDRFVWSGPPFLQEDFDVMSMAFDGRFTGRDVCLEAKWLPIRPLSGVGFPHAVLPYREA